MDTDILRSLPFFQYEVPESKYCWDPLEGCVEKKHQPIVSRMVMGTSTRAEFLMTHTIGMVICGAGGVLVAGNECAVVEEGSKQKRRRTQLVGNHAFCLPLILISHLRPTILQSSTMNSAQRSPFLQVVSLADVPISSPTLHVVS